MLAGPAGYDGCTERKTNRLISDQTLRPRHPVNEVVPELRFRRDRHVARLRPPDVYLCGDHMRLRPMTEDDWSLLLEWNNYPEVMEYADHEDFRPSTLGELQAIYPWISTHAHGFIIEVEGHAIGEC